MVHRIECFCKVQEEDTTGATPVDLLIYFIKEVGETGPRGVPLPEPRLTVSQQIICIHIFKALAIYQAFETFAN